MKRLGVVAILALLLGASVGCGSASVGSTGDATIPPNLSLDDVYARMERALDGGPDRVLHASVITEEVLSTEPTPQGFEDFDAADYAIQLWIDATNGVARVETKTRVLSESNDRVERAIVSGEDTLRVDSDGRSNSVDSLTCRGSESVLLAQLMRCGNYLEESTTMVEQGEYGGQPATVAVTTGTLPSHDWTSPFENRLYVDPESYLPVAAELSEKTGDLLDIELRVKQRYDFEFVDRSSLADDYFEPAAIGYAEDDPAASFRPDVDGMRVYWLGRRFSGVADAPPLVLLHGGAHERPVPPGYRFTASYELEGGSRNYPLDLQEFPTEAWKNLDPLGTTADGEMVPVPEGRSLVLPRRNGSQEFGAYVYFGTRVVFVVPPFEPSPYSGHDAMMEVVKSLRPYP